MAIVLTPDICRGEPRISGRRITVANILRQLASGMSISAICEDFDLKQEEVVEAITWGADYIDNRSKG